MEQNISSIAPHSWHIIPLKKLACRRVVFFHYEAFKWQRLQSCKTQLLFHFILVSAHYCSLKYNLIKESNEGLNGLNDRQFFFSSLLFSHEIYYCLEFGCLDCIFLIPLKIILKGFNHIKSIRNRYKIINTCCEKQ